MNKNGNYFWFFFGFEISGEQRELAMNRGLEQERLKVLELKHDIIKLKESKAKDI